MRLMIFAALTALTACTGKPSLDDPSLSHQETEPGRIL